MLLIVITNMYVSAKCDLPLISGNQIVYDLKDCGFSGAVISDNSHMLATFYVHFQISKKGLASKGFR